LGGCGRGDEIRGSRGGAVDREVERKKHKGEKKVQPCHRLCALPGREQVSVLNMVSGKRGGKGRKGGLERPNKTNANGKPLRWWGSGKK